MKQIIQSLKTGDVTIASVPRPALQKGHVLIRTNYSLISSGTERMLMEFGKAGYLQKAKQQPDKLKDVLNKVKTDGFVSTLEKVFSKLNQPIALGYCNVGQIIDVGQGVTEFKIGDRVASNGNHAEVVSVPENLCAKLPNKVSDKDATFTVLGAISLQSIRLAKPTIGETFVVSGLGLVGLLTVQLLRANGCKVLALDFDQRRLDMAYSFGAKTFNLTNDGSAVDFAIGETNGYGVDGVIIAAATASDRPVNDAAKMCRKRGRVILVGVAGLSISRDEFYKKEISFQVSSSYGPGRHEKLYEQKGYDFPIGYVRWTENRNFQAFLDLLQEKQINVRPLITKIYRVEEALKAYENILSSKDGLGFLINYEAFETVDYSQTISNNSSGNLIPETSALSKGHKLGPINVSFIGSGAYATSLLIPAFKRAGANLFSVASLNGLTSYNAAKKFSFQESTTDIGLLINDPSCHAVVIATRHNNHAELIIKCLKAGKHTFVEKPLCLSLTELNAIKAAYLESQSVDSPPILMVGFNRRFSKFSLQAQQLFSSSAEPLSVIITVNAGPLPHDNWTKDKDVGGGRIVGEVCHFVDYLRFLSDAECLSFSKMTNQSASDENLSATLKFHDGTIGTIHYFTNGASTLPKEKIEIYSGGRVLKNTNFKKLEGFGFQNFSKMSRLKQDKGQDGCSEAFLNSIRNGSAAPIPIDEIFEVSELSIKLAVER